jgi:hypothetical protein
VEPAGNHRLHRHQAGVLWDTSGATPVPIEVPAAVTVSRGDDITFTGDAFEHLGATAVDLADGTQDSGVNSSLITDTAGGGVSVGEVDDYFQDNTTLMTTGDTIAGNLISYVGQDYSDTVGVWAGYTRDLTVTHNDIGHTPYSGMSIGWGWGYASPCSMQDAEGLSDCEHGTNYAGGNEVTDNYIHDVMNTRYDGGPIYTNGGQAGDTENGTPVGSVLAGNYVSIGNHDDNMLYQDEGSSYWHTYDNVVNFAAGGNWIGMWTPTINNITIGPGKHTITVTDTDPNGGGLTVGEFQTPARPYLRVTTPDPYPAAGASVTVTATFGNPARTPLREAKVALLAPQGWVAGKPVTLGTILPGGTATATFTVTPPASRSPGTATFTAVASSASGTLTGSTQAETPYGSLTTAFDNIGVSADSDTSAADLDGSGYSFSATALANAGVTPGSTVTAAGLTFSWPAAAAGSPDNVVASGQEVTIDRSGNELGFLDTATYGPASGEGTIIYTDGSKQAFTLSVPDWYDGPPTGSSAAITTAYRNTPGNGQDDSPVYVYEQSVALDSSSEVAAVVLPDVSQGLVGGSAAVHIFAISAG